MNNLIRNGRAIHFRTYATQCWYCDRQFKESETKKLFCPCEKKIIQPVNNDVNYFELFNLPLKFDVDQKKLTKSFRNTMKTLHPDVFTSKSEKEKEYSDEQSSFVNNAYKTLSNDLERGLYFLKLKNFFNEQDVQLDDFFLTNMFELNERVSEVANADEVKRVWNEVYNELDRLRTQLFDAFHTNNLEEANKLTKMMTYYINLLETLKDLKLKFNIQD